MAPHRYIELDILRTLAILCMVIYHTAFDLSQFYGWDIDVFDGGWKLLARSTAILFLILVGTAAAVSDDRAGERSRAVRWKRHLRRFISIGAGAFIVSLATYSADPATYVRFGILHLIAVGALIVPMVRRHASASLPIGVAVIILGLWMPQVRSENPLLYMLGAGHGIASVDYFPLVPWMGVMFVGYGIGYWVYVKKRWNVKTLHVARLNMITWPGRHALLCYMLHQPVIIAVLWMIMGKPDF